MIDRCAWCCLIAARPCTARSHRPLLAIASGLGTRGQTNQLRRRVIERLPLAEKLGVGHLQFDPGRFLLRRNMPHLDYTAQGGGMSAYPSEKLEHGPDAG